MRDRETECRINRKEEEENKDITKEGSGKLTDKRERITSRTIA